MQSIPTLTKEEYLRIREWEPTLAITYNTHTTFIPENPKIELSPVKRKTDTHIPHTTAYWRSKSLQDRLVSFFVCILPLQVCPTPVYPALHLQEYEPTVFMQSALTSQLWVLVLHSSRSVTINKTGKNFIKKQTNKNKKQSRT